jgi:flagellar hook protein FlgE
MFGSIASALSGLLGFSKGLDVLSNNIANLNTPGFKSTELQFRDLFYRYGLAGGDGRQEQLGQGVDAGTSRTVFRQGELSASDKSLDTAIDGNGFFVLRRDGKTFYTRSGQFAFNDEGFLIDSATQARVAAFSGGRLTDIDITGFRTNAARATSLATFAGQLDTNVTGVGDPPVSRTVAVFDESGVSHNLTVNLTNNGVVGTITTWSVAVLDGTMAVGSGTIQYQGSGDAVVGQSTVTVNYDPLGAPGSTALTLNFSSTRSLSGGTNTLSADTQNGISAGSLMEVSFDEDGVLTLQYSNGQTVTRDRLALAWFGDLQVLTHTGNSLFANDSEQAPILGGPNEGGMGAISSAHLERSNVELTEQFTDMVVIQRGYQASSQVLSVTNEMIQQLLDIRGRR